MATAFGAGTVAVHDSKNPAWTRPVRRLHGDSCTVTAHALPEGCCGGPAAGAERCAHGGGAGQLVARLHKRLLVELRRSGLLKMDDAAVDGSHVRALKGAHTGPAPVDRSRPGSKHHLIADRHGTPLAVSLTGGNRHDVTQLMPLLDALPVFGEGEAGHGTGPTAVRRSRELARRSELA